MKKVSIWEMNMELLNTEKMTSMSSKEKKIQKRKKMNSNF